MHVIESVGDSKYKAAQKCYHTKSPANMQGSICLILSKKEESGERAGSYCDEGETAGQTKVFINIGHLPSWSKQQ
jgi:hypothetical protein